jgi:hypothetical protein
MKYYMAGIINMGQNESYENRVREERWRSPASWKTRAENRFLLEEINSYLPLHFCNGFVQRFFRGVVTISSDPHR